MRPRERWPGPGRDDVEFVNGSDAMRGLAGPAPTRYASLLI